MKVNKWDSSEQARLWHRTYSMDFAYYLLKQKSCICCGNTNYELGHITAPEDDYVHVNGKGKIKTNYKLSYGDKIIGVENGLFQATCHSCNNSQGNGYFCRIHQKYLGVWNYLPKIDDIEEI